MKKIFLFSLISLISLVGFIVHAEESSAITDVKLDEEVQASDLGVGNPNLLPGHPFYFLKNWGRSIRSAITFDPVKKAELESNFASEKLIELEKMTSQGVNEKMIEKTLQDYQKRIKRTEEITAKIKSKASTNKKVRDFSQKFTRQQILQQRILEKLKKQVPEEVFGRIEEVRKEHLNRFKNVLSNIENNNDIPETITKALDSMQGSDFKGIKDIEFLKQLKEQLPDDLKEKISERIDKRTELFKNKLESLSVEKQGMFKDYIDNISGNEDTYLNIIDNIKGRVLSDTLEKVLNSAREKTLEKMQKKAININSDNLRKRLKNNEDLLEKVKVLMLENDIDKDSMPRIFKLAEKAGINIEKAKKNLADGNYDEAFKDIRSSLSLSKNTKDLIKRFAGFDTSKEDASTIVCNNSYVPVCGTNNETYKNICEAKKENVGISYRGQCEVQKECATVGQKINKSSLRGSTDQECCDGLKEYRTNRNYSVCKKDNGSDQKICAQVITPAKNSEGECEEFPTPCDVPEGWTKASNCNSTFLQLKDSVKQELIRIKSQIRKSNIEKQEAATGSSND